MKEKNLWCFVVLSLMHASTFAQSLIGGWSDQLPYHEIVEVVASDDFVYGRSPYGLIEYDLAFNSQRRLSKTTGLSDVRPTAIGIKSDRDVVLVGYENGNIDLLEDGRVYNLPDIKRSTTVGNKRINKVVEHDNFLYLATGFGIVKLDVEKREIRETIYIGNNGMQIDVRDVIFTDERIYATADDGLYFANLDENYEVDFNVWQKDTTIPNSNKGFNWLSSCYGSLYCHLEQPDFQDDTLYTLQGGTWSVVTEALGNDHYDLLEDGDGMILVNGGYLQFLNKDFEEVNRVYTYLSTEFIFPRGATRDDEGVLWIADADQGLVRMRDFWKFDVDVLDAPFSTRIEYIDTRRDEIWIASGSKTGNYRNLFNQDHIFYRNDEEGWGRISKVEFPLLDTVFDFVTIKADPFNSDRVFAGSLGEGLVEFIDGEPVNIWDYTNSSIRRYEAIEGFIYTAVTGLDFDSDRNLWISNAYTSFALSVYTAEGEWQAFNFSQHLAEETTGKVIVAESGYKWLLLPNKGKGILVFDSGDDLFDLSDDQSRILGAAPGQGGLPSTDVFDMAEDQDGEMWVGTDDGVAVFYNTANIFTQGANIDAQRIFVTVNGYTQYLLQGQRVTAVAIDGANRKWFGTQGAGVYLMSEDGSEELAHFTFDNSPILSDFIIDIAVQPETGEVLISTEEGLVTFKGTATAPERQMDEVSVYPNPVRESYQGPISINGLERDSQVRITDAAGNMVFQTVSEGGQAVWNGQNMNGRRVATGVYLVYVYGDSSFGSEVARILVIN